tara:strand:- start:1185 stop:2039 length:855 start_codon:yes stop_codon:yes gene_type:complete
MAYIGVSPSNGVRRKHTYTATANQTSFSGAGAEGATLSYNDSNFVDVYQNGVKLAEEDYTATSGTAIVLAQGASADDVVEIIVFDVFSVADTVSKSAGGDFNSDITSGGNPVKVAGKESMWIPSLAMKPTTSNGCSLITSVETTSGRPDMIVFDFDKDSDEFAQFAIAFPKSWDAGTVTFQFYWSGIAATTNVTMTLQGVSFADNDSIDTAYGTAVAVTDAAQGAVEELLVSAESGAITIAGSPGENELTYFRIGRDVSEDNMAGDCRLHGIKLFFNTDTKNDS